MEVIPFGSTVSGLAVEDDCDVDVCLVCGPHACDLSRPPQQRMRATAQRCCDALVSVAGAIKMVCSPEPQPQPQPQPPEPNPNPNPSRTRTRTRTRTRARSLTLALALTRCPY